MTEQQPEQQQPKSDEAEQPDQQAQQAPEADSDEDAGSADPQVGRRPDFVEEGAEGSAEEDG